MGIIAESLDAGEMPLQLFVAYLASSIRRALAEPGAERAATILFEFGMTAPTKEARKPKHIDYHVVRLMVESEMAAKGDVSEAHLNRIGAKRFSVSPIIARKLVNAAGFMPRLFKANRLGSLVRIA